MGAVAVFILAGCSGAGKPEPANDPLAGKFEDIALKAGVRWAHGTTNPDGGVNLYDHGSGIAAGDLNGDGHEDILLLSQCGPTGYFLGRGDGTFADRSSLVSMLDDGVRGGVAYGDYDEDGDVDLYVTFTRRPNALLRQNGDGTFTDIAAEAGVALNGHYSGASFADVNKDGYLDLVVAGNKRHTLEKILTDVPGCAPFYDGRPADEVFGAIGSDPTALFINGGPTKGFAFTNMAVAMGIPQGGDAELNLGFADAVLADLDVDGAVDLVLPEMFGHTVALRNDGTGHFTPATAAWIPRVSWGPASASVGDFNNDGWPDLYFTDMHSDMYGVLPYSSIDPSLRYKGSGGARNGVGDKPEGPLYGNSLFFGVDGKSFKEMDLAYHAETYQPWGNLVADFDNDGNEDVFLPSGMSQPFSYIPNAFLLNDGTRFQRREKEVGLDPPPAGESNPKVRVVGQPLVASARSSAVADFDEDGALDLVVMTWSDQVNVFRNHLPQGAHWLDVKVVGRAPHDPYGVPVRVKAGGKTYTRFFLGARGYLSQSTRWVHFGLGKVGAIDSVSVTWPDGKTTTVDHPPVDARVTLEQ